MTPQGLQYARVVTVPPRYHRIWLAVVPAVLSYLGAPIFMCACGHLGQDALVLTVPLTCLACFAWVSSKAPFPWRVFHMLATLLCLYILLRNALDVLWYGHGPVFARPPRW